MKNLITDIGGIKIGNAHCEKSKTGVTLIVPDKAAITAVSALGGAPGTRETDALQSVNLVQHADAIVLAGGSVYGLEAASELTSLMGKTGRGFPTNAPLPSPIVPAAILFDMANGGDKSALDYRALARKAYDNLAREFELGNHGAGFGAQAGARKGGLGSASATSENGARVGALVAVNSLASVCDESGAYWAHYLLRDEDGVETRAPMASALPFASSKLANAFAMENTTIGVVACDVALSRVEAERLAIMAQDGLARALRVAHTPFDGDTVFACAIGARDLGDAGGDAGERWRLIAELGALASDSMARAICRAVHFANV